MKVYICPICLWQRHQELKVLREAYFRYMNGDLSAQTQAQAVEYFSRLRTGDF